MLKDWIIVITLPDVKTLKKSIFDKKIYEKKKHWN